MSFRAQLLQTMKENMTLMSLGKRKLWDPFRLLSISLHSVWCRPKKKGLTSSNSFYIHDAGSVIIVPYIVTNNCKRWIRKFNL